MAHGRGGLGIVASGIPRPQFSGFGLDVAGRFLPVLYYSSCKTTKPGPAIGLC